MQIKYSWGGEHEGTFSGVLCVKLALTHISRRVKTASDVLAAKRKMPNLCMNPTNTLPFGQRN
jgi:hypothetical protein